MPERNPAVCASRPLGPEVVTDLTRPTVDTDRERRPRVVD
jgi:hypothetical protein